VGDKNVTEGIVFEITLKPVAGFKVEVVGGLIEQEQVGLGQQELGESDAHLPAAAELIGLAAPILFGEAEAGEHSADLGVERVAVEGVKALLKHGIALGCGVVLGAGVVKLGKLAGEPLHLRLHLAQFVKDGEALFKDRSAGELKALLRQIADAHAAGLLHLAVVQRFKASKDLHQSGLAGAVGADQRGLLLATDEPVGLQEEYTRSKALAGILQ
jgi:hypothetical protein